MLSVLAQSPRDYGFDQTRWTLASLVRILSDTLATGTPAGLSAVLARLGIRYRRGWEHVTSPDPLARFKLSLIDHLLTRVSQDTTDNVVLWLDELTIYRLPSLAPAWADGLTPRGGKARLSPGANTTGRIGAVMNHFTGQVTYMLRSIFGPTQLCHLYHLIRQTYPDASSIFVIQDCWPHHFAPQVSATASALHIALVPLPTYSSWRNPIEKLWRWLKQDVLHMHPWADHWPLTKTYVCSFLDRFAQPSPALLRYAGLFR